MARFFAIADAFVNFFAFTSKPLHTHQLDIKSQLKIIYAHHPMALRYTHILHRRALRIVYGLKQKNTPFSSQ